MWSYSAGGGEPKVSWAVFANVTPQPCITPSRSALSDPCRRNLLYRSTRKCLRCLSKGLRSLEIQVEQEIQPAAHCLCRVRRRWWHVYCHGASGWLCGHLKQKLQETSSQWAASCWLAWPLGDCNRGLIQHIPTSGCYPRRAVSV